MAAFRWSAIPTTWRKHWRRSAKRASPGCASLSSITWMNSPSSATRCCRASNTWGCASPCVANAKATRPGGGPAAPFGWSMENESAFDDAHDATRARIDQHDMAVHHRVAIAPHARHLDSRRHVVELHLRRHLDAYRRRPLGRRRLHRDLLPRDRAVDGGLLLGIDGR